MDRTVPAGAALLLDFIGDIEAPRGYNTIYGNNQHRLKTPLTQMTIGDVVDAQAGWTKAYGSSASGRYQFMKATLIDLSKELHLRGNQILEPNLQDRLAYHLLKRRGYAEFMAGQISRTEFGKRLAQEWASLPVLTYTKGAHRELQRGQSYYEGDKLNKSLVKPEAVEAMLDKAKAAGKAASASKPVPAPQQPPTSRNAPVAAPVGFWAWLKSLFNRKATT